MARDFFMSQKKKHKRVRHTNPPKPRRAKGLKTSKAEVGLTFILVVLWILAMIYDSGLLDRFIPESLEDFIVVWGIIFSCALYSIILLDQNRFVRHLFLWVYGSVFVLLSVFRGNIVHSALWQWQDSVWLLVTILKVACLLGFLHLAYLALRDYRKIISSLRIRYQAS
ncbi:MAG: hypothetical protein JWO13_1511 [Acidobacteriales bacterium]|nr:hypothetical protein [Terriglobales bacterium]